MKVIVYHSGYGCDTGCCGHVVELQNDDGTEAERERRFQFVHPYGEDPKEFAKRMIEEELGEEHVADLDWENCRICAD